MKKIIINLLFAGCFVGLFCQSFAQNNDTKDEEWIKIIFPGDEYPNAQLPFNFTQNQSVVQVIYAANLINKDECTIKGIKYFYNNLMSPITDYAVKVFIAPTTLTHLNSGWIPTANFTEVFNGVCSLPMNGAGSELDINFTNPFLYTGGNICIMTVRSYTINTTSNVQGINRVYSEYNARFWWAGSAPVTFDPANHPGTATPRVPITWLRVEVNNEPTEFTVIISPSTNGEIEVKNGETIVESGAVLPIGTMLTFNTIPITGYHLVAKYLNGEIFEGNSFELTKSVTLSADFAINKYSITWVTPQNGTVTVREGYNYLTSGDQVNYNATISIAAAANTGYTLNSLTVNGLPFVSGQTMNVTQNLIIETNITIKSYPVSWVNPNGATISIYDGENPITNGSIHNHFISLTAFIDANNGYEVTVFQVNGSDIEWGDNITVTSALTFTGTTEPILYTITYNNLNGATNTNPITYNIETSTINLQQLSQVGYTFEGWFDNANFNGNEVTQIVQGTTGDKEFWAKWAPIIYQITATAGANGNITPNGIVEILEGTDQKFDFSANTDYYVFQILIDGINNATAAQAGTYTFTNVTQNHTIEALFATGIKENHFQNVRVFVKQNVIHIQTDDNFEEIDVQIIDLTGRILFNNNLTSKTETISIIRTAGVYFVTLRTENAQKTYKLIIK